MEAFQEKFFPDVYYHVKNHDEGSNAYCKYNNQGLQLFTSSLFIAGMIGGVLGGFTTRYDSFQEDIVHAHHFPTLYTCP